MIGVQLLGIGAAFLWSFTMSFILFKVVDMLVNLRVSPEEEMEGLDFSEHGGNAYPDFEISSYANTPVGAGPSSGAKMYTASTEFAKSGSPA